MQIIFWLNQHTHTSFFCKVHVKVNLTHDSVKPDFLVCTRNFFLLNLLLLYLFNCFHLFQRQSDSLTSKPTLSDCCRIPALVPSSHTKTINMIKMPLFGKSQKSPAEVVKALKEAVTSLEKGDKKLEKVSRLDYVCCFPHSISINCFLGTRRCEQKLTFDQEYAVRYIRQRAPDWHCSRPTVSGTLQLWAVSAAHSELVSSGFWGLWVVVLHFELSIKISVAFSVHQGKKDVAQIFNNILRRQIGTRSPTVEYICTKPEILFTLVQG